MDIMNLQNFMANQTLTQPFAEKSGTSVRQPQNQTNSFASKLNKAVERSVNGVSGNEAARSFNDMEKLAALNNENNIIVGPSANVVSGNETAQQSADMEELTIFNNENNIIVGPFANGVSNNEATEPPADMEKPATFINGNNIIAGPSANVVSGNEAAQPSDDMEKLIVFNNKNSIINENNGNNIINESNIINENQPKQTAEDHLTDTTNATNAKSVIDGEQFLTNVKPEISEEFLGATSLMVQMPAAMNNIIGEDITVQFSTSQDKFSLNLLSEQPGTSLTAEDLKWLPPGAKISESIFPNADAMDKGQVISQATTNEPLVAAKQNFDIFTAKGELPKFAETESEVVLQQPNDIAKQPQARLQSANLATEFTKIGTEVAKPGTEVTKPGTEAVKPETELLKPGVEMVKPAAGADVAKPVAEIAKLTVIDAAKPTVEIARPNEQSKPGAGETTNLMPKEPAEQNLANQQNTAGQQSFDQTLQFKAGQIKNPDQQPNDNHTPFAVSFDAATQNTVDKPSATHAQQQTPSGFTTLRDEFQIKEQIIQQAVLINRSAQESEMTIRLKPEHLGELALKVTVNSGVVSASFHSDNAEVRGILENSVQQLKNDLANAGFKVDSVSISAGLSQFNADQERAMQWQQKTFSAKNNGNRYEETVETQTVNQIGVNFSKNNGVEYLI